MSAREQLQMYLQQLERRLRWNAGLRGAAVFAASALGATLVLVAIANRFAFSGGSVAGARLVLAVVLVAVGAWGLALPLRRLSRRRAAQRAEAQFPAFQQRLTTFTERDTTDPFLELLAADTLELTSAAHPRALAPDGWLWSAAGASFACLGVLAWMIAAGPGYWGYGAALLWTGPRSHAVPLYSLRVTPGNAVVRRHGDQLVTALPHGLAVPEVRLFARYESASKWEVAPMRAQAGRGGSYQYLFAGLPENVAYYIEADALRSPVYHIAVRDLPIVKQISVTYHYPAWTGLKDLAVARAGDLRAVAGTHAELEVFTDQPLQGGELTLDSGERIPLAAGGDTAQGHRYRGVLNMAKDGIYHVAAQLPDEPSGEAARLSEDFFIAAPPAAPPRIALVRPGRDYHASPIEEVTVVAQASDEYGLKDMALHYSVNGGPEKTVEMLQQPGARQAGGQALLSFESFHAQPGDVVSVYATARDGNAEAHTEMMFVQADPFERDFSQSQQSGGGGGGGQADESAQIADREKEIIAATFEQQGKKSGGAKTAADTARLLAQSQATLHDQAQSLSGRVEARELSDENQAFSDFDAAMGAAADAMAPAAASLQGQKWGMAIPNEEEALRYLLRADATFRQIEVAFGSRGGAGGGGGAGRDLASLMDLELDTQKNQYETQQTASTAEQQAQAIDDTLKKLDELARRQQDLAQPQNTAQSAEQRWQQEMLRREAEQLQQQLQSLAQSQNAQSQSGQSQSGQQSAAGASSSSSPSTGSQSSAQSATAQAAAQAMSRLRQANQEMQRAAAQGESRAQSAADAQQAADSLRQALQALSGLQRQGSTARLGAMADEAGQLAQAQKQQADQVRQMIAQKKDASQEELNRLIQGRQQVSDQLDQLEKDMREAAQDLNSTQPAASSKLRGALDGMDSSDLATRLQRSADWLRNGSFSDDSETALTQDLQRLGQQVRQAQQALGSAQSGNTSTALAGAMDQVERLRQQIAALGGENGNQAARNGSQPNTQNGAQNGSQNGSAGGQYQPGQLSRGGGTGGQQAAQNNMRNGAAAGSDGGNIGNANAGNAGGIDAGRVGNVAGGYGNRYGNGGYDTGNNRIVGQAVAPQAGPNPADTERQIQQEVAGLDQLRQSLPNDAETQREIAALIAEMRNLDPSRFPDNPEVVAALHQELLSGVDTLELQIRRQLDAAQGGSVRGQAPEPAAPGYEDAVAAYYRQLSAGAH